MGFIGWVFAVTIVMPVSALTLYVAVQSSKKKQAQRYFEAITRLPSTRKKREEAAYRATELQHKNKSFAAGSPIVIDIQTYTILGYELLKAEIRYLLHCVERTQSRKDMMRELPAGEFVKTVEDQIWLRHLLNTIDYRDPDLIMRILMLGKTYREAVKLYRKLPPRTGYPALAFIPLFKVVDKTPTRTRVILPRYDITPLE